MWYYIRAGESQGPFDERAFDELVAQGAILPDSMVWNESLAGWTTLRQARPGAGVSATAESTCAICQTPVSADNLIELGGVRVCAACKPLAVQKMREGVGLTANGTAWRDGKKVVVHDKACLPQRCVKCNAETSEPAFKRKLYWHHPAYFLLIFINVLLYLIVAIIIRKRGSAEIYMCAHHRARRRWFLAGLWLGMILALVLIIVGWANANTWIILLGVLTIIAAAVSGMASSVVRTARIANGNIWLTGAGKNFLASLPPWTN
jgi:hypothetical protein